MTESIVPRLQCAYCIQEGDALGVIIIVIRRNIQAYDVMRMTSCEATVDADRPYSMYCDE
jgi:hypothetical protein